MQTIAHMMDDFYIQYCILAVLSILSATGISVLVDGWNGDKLHKE